MFVVDYYYYYYYYSLLFIVLDFHRKNYVPVNNTLFNRFIYAYIFLNNIHSFSER